MKKLSVLFVLFLCILLAPYACAEAVSGTCGAYGDNLTWTLDDNGVLTISGEGLMANYDYYEAPLQPWLSIMVPGIRTR